MSASTDLRFYGSDWNAGFASHLSVRQAFEVRELDDASLCSRQAREPGVKERLQLG